MDVIRVLLPGVTGHKVQLVSARLEGTLEHPFDWKSYSWKKASEEVQDLQMAAVEIFWFRIWLADGTPDNYLGAYHHLADQIVFKDPKAGRETFMEMLRKSGDPASSVEQRRLAVEARNLVRELGGEVDEDETLTLSITAGTRKHMKLGGASVVLSGIKNNPDDDFIDVEESLKEISHQALDNNMYRGVAFDEEGIRMERRGFGAAAQSLDRLPDALRFDMQRSGKDPESFEERVEHAEELVRRGPGGWDRLKAGRAKSAANATAKDLMPSSQLNKSGGVTRCGILDIKKNLETKVGSLFNTVAHYGMRKKGPGHLLSGYRHIFVESAMSRLVSSMDGQHLADICGLVGVVVTEPFLLSERFIFSSHGLGNETMRLPNVGATRGGLHLGLG